MVKKLWTAAAVGRPAHGTWVLGDYDGGAFMALAIKTLRSAIDP